jgi:hypothetical protein
MKPVNASTRKKSFTNFLIFFIITAIVMVATFFFSIQVPLKENEQLRNSVAEAQRQQFFSATFSAKVAETMKLLDSVNRSEMLPQSDRLDAAIGNNLSDMNAMVLRDSSLDKPLYQSVSNALSFLKLAKKQLREASGQDKTVDDLKKQVNDLSNRLLQASLEIQAARNAVPQH